MAEVDKNVSLERGEHRVMSLLNSLFSMIDDNALLTPIFHSRL